MNDGDKAIRFFEKIDRDESLVCPALVILDINLPKKQGGSASADAQIAPLRQCPGSGATSSDSARDREDP